MRHEREASPPVHRMTRASISAGCFQIVTVIVKKLGRRLVHRAVNGSHECCCRRKLARLPLGVEELAVDEEFEIAVRSHFQFEGSYVLLILAQDLSHRPGGPRQVVSGNAVPQLDA